MYIHVRFENSTVVAIKNAAFWKVTLMMEGIFCSEMSVLTRAKLRRIPEDGILYFKV
jgi:hypothetical protein